MEFLSSKCEIREDRKIIAIEDLNAGELLLAEPPLIVTPPWDSTIRCSNCFKDSIVMCNKCLFFPLCMSCPTHDQFDCNFFRNVKRPDHKNFLVNQYSVFGPLKCLLLLENEDCKGNVLLKLKSTHIESKSSDDWNKRQRDVVTPFIESGILENFKRFSPDAEFLHSLCGIIDANSFQVRNSVGDVMKGIYHIATNLEHNCVQNTLMTFTDDFQMKVVASVLVREGESLRTSFANPLLGTSIRRHLLKVQKNLFCTCQRCEDPSELGTHLSSLKCCKCTAGYVVHFESEWKCEKCDFLMDRTDVHKTLMEANKDIITADGDIRNLEMLLIKFSRIFHPNHYLILDVKQSVASILRNICTNNIVRPGKNVFLRKVQLCEQILPILRVLQPGISKLTAIGLHEYFSPQMEVTAIEYDNGEISSLEYLNKLQKITTLAEEAVYMLSFEEANSPEGQMASQLKYEIENLYLKMDELK